MRPSTPRRAIMECEHCGGRETHRIIGRVAYHASESDEDVAARPEVRKDGDASMRKSPRADPDRLLRKMKPFSSAKDHRKLSPSGEEPASNSKPGCSSRRTRSRI